MKERFIKLPTERARVWDGLSWFCRALGSELFRAFEERQHSVGDNWERVVCGALCVSGEERGNVVRGLRKLREAGVLVIDDGTLQLLYSERTFKALRSASGTVPPSADSGSGPVPPGFQSGSGPGPLPFHSASSAENDSGHPLKRDREIERETHRRAGAREGVCGDEASGQSEREQERFAASVERRFRSLYLERFEVDPATGGKPAADFPDRLASSARARRMEPLALLELAFGLWVDAGRPGLAEAGAYTAFVRRFAELLAPSSGPKVATGPTPAERVAELRRREVELDTEIRRESNGSPAHLAKLRSARSEVLADIRALVGSP